MLDQIQFMEYYELLEGSELTFGRLTKSPHYDMPFLGTLKILIKPGVVQVSKGDKWSGRGPLIQFVF